MKNEVYKKLESLLAAHDRPTEELKVALDDHYDAKRWLNEKLGLTEENNFRKTFPLANTVETKPFAKAMIAEIVSLDPDYLMVDLQFIMVKKNKVRATKIIMKEWSNLVRRSIERKDYRFHECFYEAFKMPLTAVDNPESPEMCHKFLVWYGDYVTNGRVAVLSTNPWDFFTASCGDHRHAGFTSCIRIGGEYENTVLSYLASDCVAMFYTAKPERIDFKEGRCWMYINKSAVFQGRIYGAIYDSDLLLVRDYVQQCIEPDQKEEGTLFDMSTSAWKKRKDNLNLQREDVENNGYGYIDYGYGIMSINKKTDFSKFVFAPGICLECGGELDTGEEYKCSDCNNNSNVCCNCGSRIRYDDTLWVNDEAYCESCFHNLFYYCDKCGEVTDNEEANEIIVRNGHNKQYTVYMCDYCYRNHTFECKECGDNFYYDLENYHSCKHGGYYCENCADKYLVVCENCREEFHYDYMNDTYDDHSVCDECYKDSYCSAFDNEIKFFNEEERDDYDREIIEDMCNEIDATINYNNLLVAAA